MQFNPSEPDQQGQSGSVQQYPQRQQQPPEGTWQPPSQPSQLQPQWQPPQQQWPQPPQENPQQPMAAPQRMPQQYPPQQQWPQPPPGNPGQPMVAPQMQQPGYPYPSQPMMMPQQVVNVNIQQHQHGFFVRALYFIFIGWWAGLIWLNVGYFFVLTIIGLPFGLVMLNRLPYVLTLKPASQSVNINITGNTTNISIGGAQQINFWIRALYFIFVGWWAGLAWSGLAYGMFVCILTMPVGIMMFNILPAVITLRKN